MLFSVVSKSLDNLSQKQFEDFLKGFVFTYRLKKLYLKNIVTRYSGFIQNLSPDNLARLHKAFYMYDLGDSKFS